MGSTQSVLDVVYQRDDESMVILVCISFKKKIINLLFLQLTKDAVQKLKNTPKAGTVVKESTNEVAAIQKPPKEVNEPSNSDLWIPFLDLKLGSASEEERHRDELARLEQSYQNQEKKLEETNLHLIHLVNRLDTVGSDIIHDMEKKRPNESSDGLELMKKVQSCLESNASKTLNCSRIVNDYADAQAECCSLRTVC